MGWDGEGGERSFALQGRGGGGAASLRLRGMGGEPVARVRSAAGADRSPRGAESDGAVPGRWGWGGLLGLGGGGGFGREEGDPPRLGTVDNPG